MRDAVDAAASGAHGNRRAGQQPVSDQAARGRTALRRFRESFGETGTKLVERLFRRRARTAKSCGPGTRCWCQVRGWRSGPTGRSDAFNPRTTVARRNSSPGRSRISRKTIAQGRPDDPPVPVVLPRAFCCTRTMGASGHPAFPAPSCFWRDNFEANLGRIASRERADVPQDVSIRHCERSEAIQGCANHSGLLRFARNDGAWLFEN